MPIKFLVLSPCSKPLDKTMLGVVLQRMIAAKDGEIQVSTER